MMNDHPTSRAACCKSIRKGPFFKDIRSLRLMGLIYGWGDGSMDCSQSFKRTELVACTKLRLWVLGLRNHPKPVRFFVTDIIQPSTNLQSQIFPSGPLFIYTERRSMGNLYHILLVPFFEVFGQENKFEIAEECDNKMIWHLHGVKHRGRTDSRNVAKTTRASAILSSAETRTRALRSARELVTTVIGRTTCNPSDAMRRRQSR